MYIATVFEVSINFLSISRCLILNLVEQCYVMNELVIKNGQLDGYMVFLITCLHLENKNTTTTTCLKTLFMAVF